MTPELLSTILGEEVLRVDLKSIKSNIIHYYTPQQAKQISTFELSSKCKDRATQYGFSITTGNRLDGTKNYDVLAIHSEEDIECSDAVFYNAVYGTEAEGTLNAFQWILNQVGAKA